MAEGEDLAMQAAGYQPPTNAPSSMDLSALIAQAVEQRLKQMGVQAAPQRVQKSPEEEARDVLENAGAGLGHDERFAEVYKVLALLASKVGV